MDPKLWPAIIAGFTVVIGAIIGAPRLSRDPLDRIRKAVDVYSALPATSRARASLLQRIEQDIDQLSSESTARRNPYGVFWGCFFTFLGLLGLWFVSLQGGGWWWVSPIPIFLGICGVIVFFQNFGKVPRAANGQTLKYQQEQAAKKAKKAAGL